MGGGGKSANSQTMSALSPLTSPTDVNVAYDGTFDDLCAPENDKMFDLEDDLDYAALLGGNRLTAGNGVTVSPKDVFNCDSIPPSTSFTNLTTPGSSYLETPADDYETSPLFADNLGFGGQTGADNWYPLFSDQDTSATTGAPAPPAPSMSRSISSSSANQILVHPGCEPNRKRSSTAASPMFSPALKHSNVAGVGARKRDKPLPPIMVDENDAPALKRARNTAAARKSRAKRVAERDDQEVRIAELEAQVEFWKSRAIAAGASGDDRES